CLTGRMPYYKISLCLTAVSRPVNGGLPAVYVRRISMRTTYMPQKGQIERKWYLIDAAGKPLGRLATEVARILRGKHKPIFTPHLDTGDHVIVINASQVVLTGNKA